MSYQRLMILILWITFLPLSAPSAAVFHVDARHGASEADGSRLRPFRTIKQAVAVALPGDTIRIGEGVYHEQIMGGASGLPDAPIVIEGSSRHTVFMRGSVRVRDWERRGDVWIKRGLNPMTLENAFVMIDERKLLDRVDDPGALREGSFHVSDEGVYMVRLPKDADPNTEHAVDVYEYDFAFNAGDRWGGTAKRHIILRNMTLEKYGVFAVSTDKEHPRDNSHWELDRLIVRYNLAEGVFYCLDDWHVHDCEFIRNGVHGCQINGARVRFEDNLCAENEWFGPSGHGGCGLLIGPDESAHSCTIRNNIFSRNGAVKGYGCGVYLEGRSHDNVIENNYIVGGTAAGVGFYGSSGNRVINNVLIHIARETWWDKAAAFVFHHSLEGDPTEPVGNLVAHNTVWKCAAPLSVEDTRPAVSEERPNRVINNLFAYCRLLPPPQRASSVKLRGNAWYRCPENAEPRGRLPERWIERMNRAAGFTGDDHNTVLRTNPGLRDPESGRFDLTADSPLKGAGVLLPEASPDRAGAPRGVNGPPSVGAYE